MANTTHNKKRRLRLWHLIVLMIVLIYLSYKLTEAGVFTEYHDDFWG